MNIDALKIIANQKIWRSAEMFHIPTIIASGSIPDSFYEMILDRDNLQKKIPFFYCDLDRREAQESDREEMEYHIIDCLIRRAKELPVFIGSVECPVFQRGGMYSWGYYQSEWMVFDEISELIQAGDDLQECLQNIGDETP